MQKETLTLSHIQQDIRSSRRENDKYVILYSVLFIALLGAYIPGLIVFPGDFFFALPLVILGCGILLYKIIQHARKISALCGNVPLPDRIARDTLSNAEHVDRYRAISHRGKYHFHFARYGKYVVPEKNYTWSSAFSMSDQGVYNYAVNGDEFYLVLSKPHSGKILFVYNAKMFELEE